MGRVATQQRSKGAIALASWLGRSGLSRRALGRQIGASAGSVGRWVTGQYVPSVYWAARIEAATKVPAAWWGLGSKEASHAISD
jgi:hypothetical protein